MLILLEQQKFQLAIVLLFFLPQVDSGYDDSANIIGEVLNIKYGTYEVRTKLV